jgi:hypothetical protein
MRQHADRRYRNDLDIFLACSYPLALKLPHVRADYPIGTMCLLVLLHGLGKIGLHGGSSVV